MIYNTKMLIYNKQIVPVISKLMVILKYISRTFCNMSLSTDVAQLFLQWVRRDGEGTTTQKHFSYVSYIWQAPAHQFLQSFNNVPNVNLHSQYEWTVVTLSASEVNEPVRQVLLGPI